MVKFYTIPEPVDASILGDTLTFPTAKITVRNRFLKSAMTDCLATWDPKNPRATGLPTTTHVNFFEKWAAGGYGLILTGGIAIDENHAETSGSVIVSQTVNSTERRKALGNVARAVKEHKGLIIGQLSHGGKKTPAYVNPHPFVVSKDADGQIELTADQIQQEIVSRFVYTARVLYESGFNGIELLAGHGYLLSDFLSPQVNKRTDNYGGSAANRARVVIEIYDAIRKVLPARTGFIIGIKISSFDYQNPESKTEDAADIAAIFDNIGFDYINLTGGSMENVDNIEKRESTLVREAFFNEFIAAARSRIVYAVTYITGGFKTVPAMVDAVKERITDGIGLGRPATQLFNLPRLILSGRVQSAAVWPFGDDFLTGILACALQLSQAGAKPLSDSRDINDGIMDLTDEKLVEQYRAAQAVFLEKAGEAAKKGVGYPGVVPFHYKQKS